LALGWSEKETFGAANEMMSSLFGQLPFQINAELNDTRYNPATNGQGFFISLFPDSEQMFLTWFTYDIECPDGCVVANLGDPGHRWLTAFGPYTGSAAVLNIEIAQAGVFDSSTPAPSQGLDGTIAASSTGKTQLTAKK